MKTGSILCLCPLSSFVIDIVVKIVSHLSKESIGVAADKAHVKHRSFHAPNLIGGLSG